MSNKKEYQIIINGINESIEGIGTLQDSLEKLGRTVKENSGTVKESSKSMDELAKAEKKITEYNEEYQRALLTDKAVLSDKNKAIKDSIDIEKANITVQQNVQGTYQEKQRLLTALGKVIKTMNTDTEEEKQRQKELMEQYASLNQELKDFDAELGNHQRNVGDYALATTNLKKELKELQTEMANMLADGVEKTDPAFVALAEKAGKMKDAIQDAGEEVKRFASDTKALDDVINIAKSATAAFELYKGAMSAFGLETKEAEEAIQQLAGAMSIIQSLETLQETLNNGSATARLFSGVMKALGVDTLKQEAASIKATAAQQGLTVAQKAGTIATKTLSMAIKAIPLMLVIGLVTELVLHWKDLMGWFDKTFPALKQMGGAMNGLKAVFKGLGEAIVNWVTNPIKTMIGVIQKVFKGDFAGALKEVGDGITRQFKGTADAFTNNFVKQVKKGQEEMTLKTVEESNKRTQQELKELKIQERNNKTYSKKYIDLQKKDFEERKKLARGNQEELNKIKVEEMQFDADVQDKITQNRQKHNTQRVKNASAATNAVKKEEDEWQKYVEKVDKEVEDANKAVYDAEYSLSIKRQQLNIERLKDQVKLYEKGNVDKYTEAVKNLYNAELKLRETEQDAKLNDYFINFKNIVGDDIKELNEFKNLFEQFRSTVTDFGTDFEHISFNEFDAIIKNYDAFKKLYDTQGLEGEKLVQKERENLANRQKLYSLFVNYVKEGMNDREKQTIEIYKGTIEQLKKVADKDLKDADENAPNSISPITRLFSPKKAKKATDSYKSYWKKILDLTETNIDNIEKIYDNYLSEIVYLYGKDSEQYAEAEREKTETLEKYLKERAKLQQQADTNTPNNNAPKTRNGQPMSTKSGDTNWEALWDSDGEIWKNIEGLYDTLAENVFDPINDAFSAMLEFQIEEAEEALDRATEMHDKSVERLEASKDRVQELNDKMMQSSGAQLEAYKAQQADEMLLMAQREAEEKRLAREQEKREKELEKKQKEQRKMELKQQLIQAIVNTSVGATKALDWGFPLGPVFAAVISAMGAIEVATISKQISKLAKGGVLGGKSHAQGGIPVGNTGIEVEGGEAVINKRSTAKYLPLLDAINADGNGGKHTLLQSRGNVVRRFADGGQLNYNKISNDLDSINQSKIMSEAIQSINFTPVVSVVDFVKAEKNLVKVRELAGSSK